VQFGDLLACPCSGMLLIKEAVLVSCPQHRDVADAVLGKPPLAVGIVRHSPGQPRPEPQTMILLSQVDELVDDDILDDAWGQADRAPVEVQVTGRAARAPVVAEVHHPDRADGHTDAPSEEFAAALYPRLSPPGVPASEVLVCAVALVFAKLEAALVEPQRGTTRLGSVLVSELGSRECPS
jgi:hypothetical protein